MSDTLSLNRYLPAAMNNGLTFRSLFAGFLLAMLLCGINSYLTLSFGVIEEGPTIAALFFFTFFFLSKRAITSTELAIVATMGSAGGSLGFISNFFAAKAMTGEPYGFWQMAGFSVVSSAIGLIFVVPLRDLLVLKEKLPWPGAKAVQSVVIALTDSADRRQPYYLLITAMLAVTYVVLNEDGPLAITPSATMFPFIAASAGIAWSPFAIGGSYLMGLRTCVGFLFGGIILMIMAPYTPDAGAPHRYIWPGIGFLLASGLTALALNWRVVGQALGSITRLRGSADDDDPVFKGHGYLIFVAIALFGSLFYGVAVIGLSLILMVVLILLGGLVQNIIATRAQAQTAFNPARVMGVLLQGAVAAFGGNSPAVNLTGAGFVAGSGAQAGALTSDFAYGRWLKVPARWQFWAQVSTVVPCSVVAAYVFEKIHQQTPLILEGGQHPAPVAKIWATTALIFSGEQKLPDYAIEAMLIAAGIAVVYTLIESRPKIQRFLPDSIGLGLGLVLSVSTDVAFFVGGFLMWIVLGKWFKVRDLTLTTIAVGCIVAEGIGGVLQALLTQFGVIG